MKKIYREEVNSGYYIIFVHCGIPHSRQKCTRNKR